MELQSPLSSCEALNPNEGACMQTAGKAKAVVLFVHGHGAYLMHELLHIPVRTQFSPA